VEVENPQLAGGRTGVEDVGHSAGDLAEQDVKADGRADHIHDHLDDIGPDNGGHAPFERVEEGQDEDQQDGGHDAGVEDDGDDDGDGKNAHALGESAGDEKDAGGNPAHARAEAALHQFIGGEHLAAKVLGQKNQRDNDARQQVAEHHLQEDEAAGIGERRRADDREGACFGRDDGERNGPPGSGPAAEEVIFQGSAGFGEARPKPRDGGEIGGNNREIDVAHGLGRL